MAQIIKENHSSAERGILHHRVSYALQDFLYPGSAQNLLGRCEQAFAQTFGLRFRGYVGQDPWHRWLPPPDDGPGLPLRNERAPFLGEAAEPVRFGAPPDAAPTLRL